MQFSGGGLVSARDGDVTFPIASSLTQLHILYFASMGAIIKMKSVSNHSNHYVAIPIAL